jgi:hypothetical protein
MADLFPPRERPERKTSSSRRSASASDPTDAARFATRLAESEAGCKRLHELRGWLPDALATLGVGFDGERITFPICNATGQLVNLLRWTPSPKNGERKMLSGKGRPRDLFPAPESIEGAACWLVEGEPDAVSLRTLGLPAVAIPGVNWARKAASEAHRFARFDRLNLLLDCDHQGREAAQTIGAAFAAAGIAPRVLDLDPSRDDGYDVGDYVREAAKLGADGLASARQLLGRMADDAASVVPPPPPDLEELLDSIDAFVARYVVLPGEHEAVAVALFILHTWAIDGAHATPYLLVISPEKRSGKTRLLEVLGLLVRAPWHTSSTSEAALFRKIERDKPTLLLDEIDAIFGSNTERTEPLRAVLNAGNRRGVTVTRCVGNDHEIADFGVFCAKVLAGIDKDRRLPETIRDRAVTIRMRRRHDAEPVERFRERKAQEHADPIRDGARAWAAAKTADLIDAEPHLPEGLGDRAGDAWESLLAIADLAGGEWPARAAQRSP